MALTKFNPENHKRKMNASSGGLGGELSGLAEDELMWYLDALNEMLDCFSSADYDDAEELYDIARIANDDFFAQTLEQIISENLDNPVVMREELLSAIEEQRVAIEEQMETNEELFGDDDF